MINLPMKRCTAVVLSVAGILITAASASAQPTTSVSFSTTPSLYPAFSDSVSDYSIRCTGTPVQVSVTAAPGTKVSVDGQPAQGGKFSASVNVTTGQEFAVVARHGNAATTWYARCLPTDFPGYTATVNGQPQPQYFLTAPIVGGSTNSSNYMMMFDDNGNPIWWHQVSGEATFATVLPSHNIGWTDISGTDAHVTSLSGQDVATLSSPDGKIDFHELQTLPDGNYLVAVDTTRCCTDLSSWGSGFPSNASISDPVIEELTPGGQVVWSWDSLDHINPVVETNPQWYNAIQQSGSPYDVFHFNSLSFSNGHILVSYRHLDAVYDINQADSSILWKIGGHTDPQSLTVVNDPVFSGGGTLCGQHDARDLGDGTITIHDNGTNCGRGPRAVHYAIDTTARTATLIGSISDPMAPGSACCGSARLLPNGDWMADWGDNTFWTELTPSGNRVYLLQYTDPRVFSYRVEPVEPGVFTPAQLRSAMDAQYPR